MSDLVLGRLVALLGVDDGPMAKGLDSAKGRIGGFAKFAAAGLAGAGLAAGAAFSASLVQAMDVEKANDKMAASLGLNEAQSAAMGKVAGALYRDAYGESMADVTAAVGAVRSSIQGMAKASDADLQKATATALNFAKTFDVDVARAAQVAGQAVSTGLAKDSGQAFDLLTSSLQKVPVAVREDVLDAVDEYGPMFASLGYSGEQAFAMLVDASAKGMYGIDKTGDAIKEFTIRATDMSTASSDAYARIGLDAADMATAIASGGEGAQEATQQVIDGLLAIKDPAEQANTAIALFGTPIEDLNINEVPKFLQSMRGMSGSLGDVAGSAEKMGETLNDNAATRIEAFKRKVMGLGVDLAARALPYIEQFASVLAKTLAPVLAAVGDFIKTTLAPAIEQFAGTLGERLGPIIEQVGGILGSLLVPALKFAAAAVAVLYAPTMAAVAVFTTLAQRILPPLAAFVTGTLAPALRDLGGWIMSTVVPAVLTLAQQVGGSLRPILDQAANLITTKFIPAIASIIGWLRENRATIAKVVGVLGTLIGGLIRFVAWVLGKVVPAAMRLSAFLLTVAWPIIRTGISLIGSIVGALIRFGGAVLDRVKDVASMVSTVKEKFNDLVGFIADIPGRVSGFLSGMFDGAKDAVTAAAAFIRDKLDSLLGPIDDILGKLGKIPGLDKVGGALQGLGGALPFGATGGIVTRPTLSVIGEAGPEAVIPLNRTPGSSPLPTMAAASDGMPKRVVLRVGERDLLSLLEEVAEGVVDGARSLGEQSARQYA